VKNSSIYPTPTYDVIYTMYIKKNIISFLLLVDQNISKLWLMGGNSVFITTNVFISTNVIFIFEMF
jgi:hypothetical protein